MRIKKYLNLLRALFIKASPIYAHYGITHRCNLNCRMCNIVLESNRASRELELKEIQRLANFLSSLGIGYISIGGGEPLLRNDIFKVVEIFKKEGIQPRILTNGALLNKALINGLVSAGLRHISVSLISLKPEIQNYISDLIDTYKVVENIENISRIVPRKGRLLIINTMASRLNLEELPSLVEFAQRMDYFISFIPLQDNCDERLLIDEKDHWLVDEIYDWLIGLKRTGWSNIFNSTRFLELSKIYLKTKKVLWKCDAGRLYISINPKGEISICHKFPPIYSIIHNKVYFTKKIIDFYKSESKEECFGCMRPCWAEISLCFRNLSCFWEKIFQLGKLSIREYLKN